MYLNLKKLSDDLGWNTYGRNRLTNLLRGIKGTTSNKEIQQVRKAIRKAMTEIDTTLENLEKQ